jgi:superfamily II RNA helicase
MSLDFLRVPVIESDEDNDILELSSDDDGEMMEGFAFESVCPSTDPKRFPAPVTVPDQGVTTLKQSIVKRKIDQDEGEEVVEENVVEMQAKKPKNKQKKSAEHEEAEIKAAEVPDFASLGLSRKLLVNLSRMGLHKPTPVQAKAIPSVLKGQDLLVNAVTGSGKVITASLILHFLVLISRRLAHSCCPF